MSDSGGSRLRYFYRKRATVLVSIATVMILLMSVSGCSRIEDVINGALNQDKAADEGTNTGSGKQSAPGQNPDDEQSPGSSRSVTGAGEEESTGPQPGTAEPTDNPAASAIEGCDESTCSVSDAVTYEHLYQGPVTVVLFADYSKLDYGECKVAVLDSDGATAQLFPLEWAQAWSMTGTDLTNIFYFLDPATDATKNIFFRMPGMDGWSAAGLRPSSVGYFELFDLDYIGEDFSDIFNSQPMTSLDWGELDANGNYELKIEDAVARWDGQKYSAP